jgi:hypothetical protein
MAGEYIYDPINILTVVLHACFNEWYLKKSGSADPEGKQLRILLSGPIIPVLWPQVPSSFFKEHGRHVIKGGKINALSVLDT